MEVYSDSVLVLRECDHPPGVCDKEKRLFCVAVVAELFKHAFLIHMS